MNYHETELSKDIFKSIFFKQGYCLKQTKLKAEEKDYQILQIIKAS